MKKMLVHPASVLTLVIAVVFCHSSSALETDAIVPTLEIMIPGISRTFDITQNYPPPQDFNQLLVFCLGYGALSINLSKIDNEGDSVVLTGIGLSPAGITPIFKFGVTKVILNEAIEIGSERSPYGILWIASWVDSAVNDPPYNYMLTIKF